MASLVKWLFFSGARTVLGSPVASGTVDFFVPGTAGASRVTCYADPEESQTVTNPVTLDAAGRAEVYIKDQVEIVVKTSTGSSVRQSTNAETVDASQIVADFAGWTGTGLLDFFGDLSDSLGEDGHYKESATAGCVRRHVQDAIRQFVSPKDYGAVGNGTADDTTALQAAINRAISAKLPLNLENATYRVTGLTIASPVNIFGCGTACSKIIMTAETHDAIDLNITGAGLLESFEWADFSIIVPNTTGAGYAAIDGISASKGAFKRLHLEGTYGVKGSGLSECVFEGCSAAVKGANGGATGIGFLLGARCKALSCTAEGTVAATSYAEGFEFAGAQSEAEGCIAQNLLYGFMWASGLTVKAKATRCRTTTCTTAYRPYGSASMIQECHDSASASLVTNGGANGYVSRNNYWSDADASSFTRETLSSAIPTFTFDPRYPTNILYSTYAGTVATLTMQQPTPAPSLEVGAVYDLVIQSGSGTSITSVALTGMGAWSITMGTASYATIRLKVAPSGALTPVSSFDVFNGAGNLWGA